MYAVYFRTSAASLLVYQTKNSLLKGVWRSSSAQLHLKSENGVSKTLPSLAKHLSEKCKNVIVMAGAGLSTPSGIPDFRSPGTGLYDNLQQYNLPYPEAIFELAYFYRNPRPFLTLAKEIYPGNKYRPSIGHYFVRLLNEKGKLLRMYTQNIDGLERLAGIPAERLVEAHGTFSTASCVSCSKVHEPDEIRKAIFGERIVYCDNKWCKGLVKPDIVFFGEGLPERFFLYPEDLCHVDFLIVIGTSLEVYPFAAIADDVPLGVPRLLINRNIVGSFGQRNLDAVVECDVIDGIKKFSIDLGWEKELRNIYEQCEKNA